MGLGAVNPEHKRTFAVPKPEDTSGEFQPLMTAPKGKGDILGSRELRARALQVNLVGASPSVCPAEVTLASPTAVETTEGKVEKQPWPGIPRDRKDGKSASPQP